MKGSESMKKVLTGMMVAACVTTGVFASGQSEIVATGTETAIVKDFTSIEDILISGIHHFTIEQGESAGISVKGDSAFLDSMMLSNNDGFLEVVADGDNAIEVVITTPFFSSLLISDGSVGNIEGFDLNTSVFIRVAKNSILQMDDTFTAQKMTVKTSHNGQISGSVDTKILDVNTMSTSVINLSGSTDEFIALINGFSAGNFDNLHVQNADVSVKNEATVSAEFPGISNVNLYANGESDVTLAMNGALTANIDGESTVSYSGNVHWIGKSVDEDATLTAN